MERDSTQNVPGRFIFPGRQQVFTGNIGQSDNDRLNTIDCNTAAQYT